MEKKLTHVNDLGQANMVDVSEKTETKRTATAEGYIKMAPNTLSLIINNGLAKGDVFAIARIAGIQAAKKCGDLIPLCHPLMLSKVHVDFEILPTLNSIKVTSLCTLNGRTGVEMEALTAVSIATLTLFDMCKAVDRDMVIEGIKVVSKEGGKSGSWGQREK